MVLLGFVSGAEGDELGVPGIVVGVSALVRICCAVSGRCYSRCAGTIGFGRFAGRLEVGCVVGHGRV